jgi:hypothetical protein
MQSLCWLILLQICHWENNDHPDGPQDSILPESWAILNIGEPGFHQRWIIPDWKHSKNLIDSLVIYRSTTFNFLETKCVETKSRPY